MLLLAATLFSTNVLLSPFNTSSSLVTEITNHPEFSTSCSSIKEMLGLFLFHHHRFDSPSSVLENEVQLVEAAFNCIKIFRGAAGTVLDEPLALKAANNYFQVEDPSLISAAERAMLHSDNPSVHENMWETMMLPVFAQTFKSRPLSLWPLLTNTSPLD